MDLTQLADSVPALWGEPTPIGLRLLAEQVEAGRIELPLAMAKPVAEKTAKYYASRMRMLLTSAGQTEASFLALPHSKQLDLVDEFLADRAEVLCGITPDKAAITRWATSHGLEAPLSNFARALKGTGKGRGQAWQMTEAVLELLLAAITDKLIFTTDTDVRSEGAHLQLYAQLCVAITCSLRTSAEVPQLRDEHLLAIEADGTMLFRIPSTKPGRHRDIALRPRPDILCPVAAVARFLDWAQRNDLHRPDGVLLPGVRCTSLGGPELWSTDKTYAKNAWGDRVVPFLDAQGVDTDNLSLHGCRSMAVDAAVAAGGWTQAGLRSLGDWSSDQMVSVYARGIDTTGVSAKLHGGTQ